MRELDLIAALHQQLAEAYRELAETGINRPEPKRTRARHQAELPAPTQLDQVRAQSALRELETRRRLGRR